MNNCQPENNMLDIITLLYPEQASRVHSEIITLCDEWKKKSNNNKQRDWVSEKDVMLITYGDSINKAGEKPLAALKRFLNKYADEAVTAVHLLPMFPYTSDDGFSVVDYYEINKALGSWEDVVHLSQDYDMMYDAVVNHISKSSRWFQGFLSGEEAYRDYFITADPKADYSKVVRPRALPLLTPFETKDGIKHLWTTFSDDQIDLNFSNPKVMLEILDVLLFYAYNGARFIRLDAIGFAWKKTGTGCMHLPETHGVVKLMRAVLDMVFPGTILITETNVPHKDNISYFGNGNDEAQMVYQFPLPPLVLFSFMAGNASKLSQWAKSLESTELPQYTTYFNFLASHDGIGMRPTEAILTEDERNKMIDNVIAHGGKINYKFNSDGSKSAYELNINYMDGLTDPKLSDTSVRIDKFMAAQSILLSMIGVPGIYIHSLLGSQNWYEGVDESGINRRINREKLSYDQLSYELENKNSLRSQVLNRFKELIRLRQQHSAFSPNSLQQVLILDERAVSFIRCNPQTKENILVIVNVSEQEYNISYKIKGQDVISSELIEGDSVHMLPYQTRWIKYQ